MTHSIALKIACLDLSSPVLALKPRFEGHGLNCIFLLTVSDKEDADFVLRPVKNTL